MRRPLKILFWLGGLILVLAVFVVFGLVWALRQTPAWYDQVAGAPATPERRQLSEQMEQRVADLVSVFKTSGRWQIVFTEEQINAWLAIGLKEKHPHALPKDLFDPRVRIEPDGITLACRTRHAGLAPVLSLKVDVYLAESNSVALRIRRVRAGRLPWPLDQVLAGLSRAAGEMDLPLRWGRTGGDPVGLFPIRPVDGKKVQLDAIQLDCGRFYLAGTTE